jgi:type II secretory pathway component PulC
VKGQEEAVPAFSLEGVIMDPVSPYAVINGEIKKEGEEIQGAKVVKITEDRVVLKIGKREITLTMF